MSRKRTERSSGGDFDCDVVRVVLSDITLGKVCFNQCTC